MKGLCGGVESGAADRTFIGTGASCSINAHDEAMTQVGRWICAVAEFLSRIQCYIKKHNIKPGRHRPEVGDRRSPFPGPISEDRKHAKRVSRILCHLGIVSFGVFNLRSAIANPHGYCYRRPIAAQRFCLFQHQLRLCSAVMSEIAVLIGMVITSQDMDVGYVCQRAGKWPGIF